MNYRHNSLQSSSYKILSLSGGGVRGILSCLVLAEIEHRTSKPICKLFDLIAGSSIGGILALFLTCPKEEGSLEPKYTAKQLANILTNRAEYIFKESSIEELLGIVDDLLAPKYNSKGRESILNYYLGNTALEEALTSVFITSYDTQMRIPIFFVSRRDLEKNEIHFRKICNGLHMHEVGMATSAAPSFFSPYKLGEYCLIDGGMFANNPTALAIIEAEQATDIEQKILCSISTGSLTRRYEYDNIRSWGMLNWIQPIINIIQDAQSEAISCQLSQALPKNYKYYRFDTFLTLANDDIDDSTPGNIENLHKEAARLIKEKDKELDDLCIILNT